MATFAYGLGEDMVLEVERETIEVSTALPQPSKFWKATDSQGHEHAYVDGPDHYPTLRLEVREYWCEECHEDHEESWRVCRICGETVKPGTFVDTSPQYLPGRTGYFLNGEPITKERAEEIMADIREQRG